MLKGLTFLNSELRLALILSLGAVLGSLIRWHLNYNLISNVIGSGLIGLLFGIEVSSKLYVFFAVGFCGSLTTFSGLMLSSANLVSLGKGIDFLVIIIVHLLLGILSLVLGYKLGRKINFARLPK